MDKQIELVTTFADQAAIAIENVRLFESVEARTRELAASLEDLRTTQDRLVQTQKLASLGQLTAGIASIRSQASSPKLRSSCRVCSVFPLVQHMPATIHEVRLWHKAGMAFGTLNVRSRR